QVHLIHGELFDRAATAGYTVRPGDLGENITTTGIDLLGLPVGAMLAIGDDALVALTGLRNPCPQIDAFQAGLLDVVRYRDAEGEIVRLTGVMGVVVAGGRVEAGDRIRVATPPGPLRPLRRV
ncbi:MAG: MOSC domain-containing protein, partial [Actinomycetota bacterium]